MALWNLLLRFALLKQQVVALHHHLVAGLKPFDNFSSTVTLYPHVHPSLYIAAVFTNENNCFPPVIEHGRQGNRNGGAMQVRDYLHIGKHIRFEPAVGVWNFGPDL